MGLTATGYTRATYDDIVQAKIQKAKELFGEDIETSELTPLGKFIRINAFDQAKAEEEAELIYYSRFPNTATGVSLDRLCVFVGITRNPATAAQYSVRVEGTAGYTVPIGFEVGTESGIRFYNMNDTPIGEDSTCIITVECLPEFVGSIGEIDYAEITEIINPDVNIDRIQGVSWEGDTERVAGKDEESDYSLRSRFVAAREGQGSCTANSIKSALLRVNTVTSASVVTNDTDQTVDGRPPHSFECYVSGGEGQNREIAKVIFDKKPIGIKTYGTESYTLTDEDGVSPDYTVYFSHTGYVDVFINLKIKVSSAFEGENGTGEIKENLISYINSLGVGGDVILSTLYGRIHAVTGVVEVTDLTMATDLNAPPQPMNIEVSDYQIARCSNSNINIEVVS